MSQRPAARSPDRPPTRAHSPRTQFALTSATLQVLFRPSRLTLPLPARVLASTGERSARPSLDAGASGGPKHPALAQLLAARRTTLERAASDPRDRVSGVSGGQEGQRTTTWRQSSEGGLRGAIRASNSSSKSEQAPDGPGEDEIPRVAPAAPPKPERTTVSESQGAQRVGTRISLDLAPAEPAGGPSAVESTPALPALTYSLRIDTALPNVPDADSHSGTPSPSPIEQVPVHGGALGSHRMSVSVTPVSVNRRPRGGEPAPHRTWSEMASSMALMARDAAVVGRQLSSTWVRTVIATCVLDSEAAGISNPGSSRTSPRTTLDSNMHQGRTSTAALLPIATMSMTPVLPPDTAVPSRLALVRILTRRVSVSSSPVPVVPEAAGEAAADAQSDPTVKETL